MNSTVPKGQETPQFLKEYEYIHKCTYNACIPILDPSRVTQKIIRAAQFVQNDLLRVS